MAGVSDSKRAVCYQFVFYINGCSYVEMILYLNLYLLNVYPSSFRPLSVYMQESADITLKLLTETERK